MNQLVEDRNTHIKNLNQDNEILKQNNTDINCENTKFNHLICAYKKHLVLLISQNKKISAEIQVLMGRDNEIRNILERDGHLQDVRYQNHQIVNDSLEKVNIYLNGNIPISNEGINSNSNPKPSMSQISQNRISNRSNTYAMEQNRNLNRSQNEEQNNIISNMNSNISNNNYNNINMSLSGSGSRINPGLNSNINNLNNNEEHDQGQGDEEEMINIGENEQQNEQENQNEEEYEHEQNNNLN